VAGCSDYLVASLMIFAIKITPREVDFATAIIAVFDLFSGLEATCFAIDQSLYGCTTTITVQSTHVLASVMFSAAR